jgi:hypothetical protein
VRKPPLQLLSKAPLSELAAGSNKALKDPTPAPAEDLLLLLLLLLKEQLPGTPDPRLRVE